MQKKTGNTIQQRILAGLTVLFLAAGMLTGCGNQSQPEAETSEESSSPSSESPESEPEEALEESEPSYEPVDEKVTFMVYLTGSDLESSAAAGTNDMREMAESGIDLSRVDLLIFTGGAPVWHSEDPEIPADANVLYHLTEGGYEAVEQFDQLSMGDPANLARFLQYSYEHYPADVYDLILWDHGNGPVIGYGSDKQYGGDSLTLSEMQEALEASPFRQGSGGTGDLRAPGLSLIGFDACLMSSAELACTLADYADYMVASQETEPSFGWNYEFLGMCGRISSRDLGREIVKEYKEYCESFFAANEFFQSDYTLAVIDLSCAQELKDTIDSLFEKAAEDVSGDYSKLAGARVRTHGFGRSSTGSEYDLVDLESLALQMESKYPEQVSDLREALAKSVVVSEANIGESCGLSLFYPYYNKNYYKKTWKTEYQALDMFPAYTTFLSRFDQVWLGANLLDLYEGELVLKQGESTGTYTLQLTPEQYENYASSRYMIFRKVSENLYTLIYIGKDITDKKGLLTANFDGNVLYFTDDYGEKGIPFIRLFETIDGVTDYNCLAYAVRPPEDPEEILNDRVACDIQFSVNENTGEVKIKGIFEEETAEDGIETGKRKPVDLSEWAALEFYEGGSRYLIRDEQGRILPYTEWPDSGWISYYQLPIANGLHFTYEPIYDDGSEYFVMFEVSDVQNSRIYSELMPITLAEAPPEETAREAEKIEWDGGDTVRILEEEGISLELCAIKDQDYRKTAYMLHGVNRNDYGVTVSLRDIYLNDKISYRNVGKNSFSIFLDPGEEDYEEIEDITAIRTYTGINTPESLQFTLRAERQDNFGYLIYNRPYYLKVTGEIVPRAFFGPVLGALADGQVLFEEGGIRAELLGLGNYSAYKGDSDIWNSLLAKVKFTNLSEEEQTVYLVGLEINGIFYEMLDMCSLKSGECWDKTLEIDRENLLTIDSSVAKYGREEMLQDISEVNVMAVIGSTIYTLPVELTEKGSQEPFEAQGELLYENEKIRVWLNSFGTGLNYDKKEAYVWELWVENISNTYTPYQIFQREESGQDSYLATSDLGPGTKQLVQVGQLKENMTGEEMQIFFHSEYEENGAVDLITLRVQ